MRRRQREQKISVELKEKTSLEEKEKMSVEPKEKQSVELKEKRSVEVKEKTSVEGKGKTSVEGKGKTSVEGKGKTSVEVREKSSVEVREKSSVEVREKTSVEVKEKVSAGVTEKVSVEAREKTEVRLVFLGAAGVGKTALIQRYLRDTFEPKHRRTVEEMHCHQYQVGGANVTVEILDTSGSYSFPAMRRLSIQHSDAFALVYAVDDPESLEVVKRLQAEILAVKEDRFTPIVVVGNKIDRRGERRVSSEDALATVELNWNHSMLEASAKDDANVVEVFRELLQHARLPSRLSPAAHHRHRRETFPKGVGDRPKGTTHNCSVS
ncbi:unnamed protein product [Boreogadus saida]